MELSASRHVDAGEFHSRRSFRVRWAACPRRACRRYPRDAGIAVLNGTRKINEMAVPYVAATQPRLTRTGGAGPAAGFSGRALPVPGRQRHGGRGSGEDDGAQEQAIGCACAWGQGVVSVALAVGVEEGSGGGVRAVLGCPAGRAWFGAAAVNAPHLIALVRAGARFERGHLVERPEVRAACTTQPIRRMPPTAPGHGRGKRARMASMQVSWDVGPPNRRRSSQAVWRVPHLDRQPHPNADVLRTGNRLAVRTQFAFRLRETFPLDAPSPGKSRACHGRSPADQRFAVRRPV